MSNSSEQVGTASPPVVIAKIGQIQGEVFVQRFAGAQEAVGAGDVIYSHDILLTPGSSSAVVLVDGRWLLIQDALDYYQYTPDLLLSLQSVEHSQSPSETNLDSQPLFYRLFADEEIVAFTDLLSPDAPPEALVVERELTFDAASTLDVWLRSQSERLPEQEASTVNPASNVPDVSEPVLRAPLVEEALIVDPAPVISFPSDFLADATINNQAVSLQSVSVPSLPIEFTAEDDFLELVEDSGAVLASVAANDATTSGSLLSYSLLEGASVANGTLEFSSDGSYVYTPDTNFNGTDNFQYIVTDLATGESLVQTVNITVNADEEVAAIPADIFVGGELGESTGLLSQFYTDLPFPSVRTAESTDASLLEDSVLAALEPTTIARELNGFSEARPVPAQSAFALTGLVYLEAGSSYQVQGQLDDIFRVELGGQTLLSTTGNSFGEFGPDISTNTIRGPVLGGEFVAPDDGFYTIEVYAANHGGTGNFRLDLVADGELTPLSTQSLPIFANVEELLSSGGLVGNFVASQDNVDGGHFPEVEGVDLVARAGSPVSFNIDVDLEQDNRVQALEVADIPVGAVISDGQLSFVAGQASTTADITGFNLDSLTITLPADSSDIIELSVTVTTASVSQATANSESVVTIGVLESGLGGVDDDIAAAVLPAPSEPTLVLESSEPVLNASPVAAEDAPQPISPNESELNIEAPAVAPQISVGAGQLVSTGLLSQFFSDLPLPAVRTEQSTNAALLEEGVLAGLAPQAIERAFDGFSERIIVPSRSAFAISGLVFLEAGSEYQIQGQLDDIFRVELGGQTLITTTGNSFGEFGPDFSSNAIRQAEESNGLFVAPEDGFYTIEVYAANHGGSGNFSLDLVVDGVVTPISSSELSLFASVDELLALGGLVGGFVSGGDNSDGGYFPELEGVDVVGREATAIALNLALLIEPANELQSLLISNIPAGAVISDGDNQLVAEIDGASFDVADFAIASLSITPPLGDLSTIELDVVATVVSAGGDTASSASSVIVGVLAGDLGGLDADIALNPESESVPLILGGVGDDILVGSQANDLLIGGTGDDTLSGGTGTDAFIISAADGSNDTVLDFSIEEGDSLRLVDVLADGGELDELLDVRLGDNQSLIDIRNDSGQLQASVTLEGVDLGVLGGEVDIVGRLIDLGSLTIDS